MSTSAFVSLPYLYTSQSCDKYENVFRLCPGLPLDKKIANFDYLQIDWPLSVEVSAALLGEMHNLKAAELENYINLFSYHNYAKEITFQNEMFALNNFISGKPADDARKKQLLLEQAQKILLWWWCQEQLHEEINILNNQYIEQSKDLAKILDNDAHEQHCFEPWPLALSWEICLCNAILFLPDNIGIMAEGQMAEDLLQNLDFKPADANTFANSDARFLFADMSAAEAIYNKSFSRYLPNEMQEKLNKRRRWIIVDDQ